MTLRAHWLLAAASLFAFQDAPDPEAAATIAAWREALELDLPAEVLGPGPDRVGAGGDLATEGEALALVARALFGAGRDEEGERLLATARPDPDTLVFVELERARRALDEDELDAVVRTLLRENASGSLEEAVRFPERAEAWLLLGQAYARSGAAERAAPCLARAVDLEPLGEGAYSALHMLSQFALRAGDGASASAFIERAQKVGQWRAYYRVRRLQVREQPDEPLPRLGLAQLWMQVGQFERAHGVLSELLERFPDDASGWFHMGETERARERVAEADRAYSRALELDAEHMLARYNRAVLRLVMGQTGAARADFELLVEGPHAEEPRVRDAHLGLARILAAQGEEDAADLRYARYRALGGEEPLEVPADQR